jgi:hypothetical protein
LKIFSEKWRLFKETFNGIETFLKKCVAFSKSSRFFILNYFPINGGFFINVGHFVKFTRLLKNISRKVEAFLNMYEDFINITRLFEDIFREMKASVKKCGAFITILITFEDFFREIEAF